MTYAILSIITGLALLLLNAEYIISNKKKKQLNRPLHYIIYLIGVLNIVLAVIYLIIGGSR